MLKRLLHTSDVNVLQHLVAPAWYTLIIFDPEARLVKDDATSFIYCNALANFMQVIKKRQGPVLVFNLTDINIPVDGIDTLVVFGNKNKSYPAFQQLDWQYICNPSGTIRWYYPEEIRAPWFLSFYNFRYWKATLYKVCTRLAFSLKLPKLFSDGTVSIYTRGIKPMVVNLLHPGNDEQPNYSIFTGTSGLNRKMIVADAGCGKLSHFYKIALSEQSVQNLQNEVSQLQKLQFLKIPQVVIPVSERISSEVISITNIKPRLHIESKGIQPAHVEFLAGIYRETIQEKTIQQAGFFEKSKLLLKKIAVHPNLQRTTFAADLLRLLTDLSLNLETECSLIPVATCHGDFTRWNCYQSNDQLHVYDWEFSADDMPLYFDLFHFIVQGAVIGKNASSKEILEDVAAALCLEPVKQLTTIYNIDNSLHFRLYLFINAAYYVASYLDQPELHKEAKWLFRTWYELLDTVASGTDKSTARKRFISALFHEAQDDEYVVLKHAGKLLYDLAESSDLDLLVSREARNLIVGLARQWHGVRKLKVSGKSFMTTIQLYFTDNSFLSIDLLEHFHRKDFDYIDTTRCLNNRICVEGVNVLPPAWDYLYIFLFYQCNFSDVPLKYSEHFNALPAKEKEKILTLLRGQAGISVNALTETFRYSATVRTAIYRFLAARKVNAWPFRLFRHMAYLADNARGLVLNRGFMLTFSGVDGAGKSTILSEMKEILTLKYRQKVVVIRHRPSMLPILSVYKYGKAEAERKCVDSLPRQGNNRNLFSSLLRFGYYYFDYFFGQVLVYFRYTLRGYVVLYDRYYFDFIVDGRRSNISINQGFIKNLYLFVYKPQLNIFLYAKPEVILRRKQELSFDDITRLTTDYQELFHDMSHSGKYLCIENIDKQRTLSEIEQAFVRLN